MVNRWERNLFQEPSGMRKKIINDEKKRNMTQYTKQETILKAENVSLCYGDRTILHDINFT